MERLLRKFETAKSLVPAAVERRSTCPVAGAGAIYYGSSSAAMDEAVGELEAQRLGVDTLRVRAFPFGDEVERFVAAHPTVFVVEQNRDGQLRTMLVNELGVDPARLVPILHYDGTPITARFIAGAIAERLSGANVRHLERGKVA
jgi:2-oxoglutarate ferredoxin oxidoreductase subunit alpha